MPAFLASLDNIIIAVFNFQADGFHDAMAWGSPVTGINIDMFAVQTMRAMVRVSVPNHFPAANGTNKIFNRALKLFYGHVFYRTL
jgi:hypothetical protein